MIAACSLGWLAAAVVLVPVAAWLFVRWRLPLRDEAYNGDRWLDRRRG